MVGMTGKALRKGDDLLRKALPKDFHFSRLQRFYPTRLIKGQAGILFGMAVCVYQNSGTPMKRVRSQCVTNDTHILSKEV